MFSRYPLLSETFILREMDELKQLGHRIEVAPLRLVPAVRCHERLRRFRGDVVVEPWLSRRTFAQHAGLLRSDFRAYAQAWTRGLWAHKGRLDALAGVCAFWPKIGAIARRFERAGVEHIHAHYATHPAMAAWMIHRLTGIPFSFTVHAHDLFVHQAGLEAKLRAAAFVVTISDFNRARLACAYPSLAHKLVVVHCGVRPQAYLRPHCPAPHGCLRLLCVASLQRYKGHRVLLAACDQLRGRLDFSCRFIGWGPLRAELVHEIRRRRLAHLVHLAGPAEEEEVAGALQHADLFVLPSVVEPSGKMEGIPVALMEAMAAGVPVIASRLSGVPELVRAGDTGWLVPPADPHALADAIWELRDPGLRAALAGRAREYVGREFNAEHSARELAALFGRARPQPDRAAAAVHAKAAPLSDGGSLETP